MLDISEIEPGLWCGAYPGKELPEEINFVVNLSGDHPPEEYHGKMRGFLWMPTPDTLFHGLAWLENIVNYIAAARKAQGSVLVHCAAGVSRATFVTAAYLMKTRRMQPNEALAYVREKRSNTDPAPVFVLALQQYGEYLGINSCRSC